MTLTRREFFKRGAVGLAGGVVLQRWLATQSRGATPAKIRIGARHFGGNFEAAKRAGIEGVEPGVGGAAEKLSIAEPANRQKYKDQMQATGVAVSSLSMDLLNGNPLFSEPRAPAWVEQTIDAAKDLGAAGILIPFFGKAHLLEGGQFRKAELDRLVGVLKDLAPKAKTAGVNLGIEATLSAKMFLELLDRVGSDAVGAYYDVGNSTHGGLDVPADIRALKRRISLFHFKDGKDYLGEGKVKFEPIAEAIHAINFKGWIVLETACPSKNCETDCKRNADYSRNVLGL